MQKPLFSILIAGLLLPGAGASRPASAQMMTPAAPAAEGSQAPVGTGFTYQGFLTQSGVPAGGAWDFELSLFDAVVGGVQVGSTVTVGDEFVSKTTTGENLVLLIWDLLVTHLPPGQLQKVGVIETRDNYFEYTGPAPVGAPS